LISTDMKTNHKNRQMRIISPGDSVSTFGDLEAFALDVLVGLSEMNKRLPSKYLYDAEGSRLFTEITRLKEYYPTQCEKETLEKNKDRIVSQIGDEPFNLIEFGSGDGQKTSLLLDHFLKMDLDFQYVPIDISRSAMIELCDELDRRFPLIQVEAIVSEYFSGIKWLNNRSERKNLVLFLGSNIGNFSHAEARVFLRNLWSCLNSGDLVLIGFDLKKDIELLLRAYNDCEGVTAKFNLNMLARINRELGGQFDLSKFRHFGTYDVFSGAMESYLVSLEKQEVFIEEIGRSFSFGPWEPIHVEYSYKYLQSDIDNLARETGFVVREHLHDSKKYFIDSIWEVKKSENNTSE